MPRRISTSCAGLRDDAQIEGLRRVVRLIKDMGAVPGLILDARDIAAGPIARVMLPARITNGTHACWVEADRMDGERALA